MFDQFIIAALSGALIIAYIFGLGLIIRVFKDQRDKKLAWKEAFTNNVKGVGKWLMFCFSFFITLMIVFGVGTSILDSIGII